MKKHLVCIDTETTGLDKKNDVIIQIAAVKIDSETFEEIDSYSTYVVPHKDFEIAPGAMEKHHLTKEFILKNGKPLLEVTSEFLSFIEDCDLLSYNGTFDISFIDKDFSEIGIQIDWTKFTTYDAYQIEKTINSHKLEFTYKRYTGEELTDAHDAFADVKATIEVFKHQLNKVENLSEFEGKIISPDNSISYKDDVLVFNFGKYKDKDVYEICKTDLMYIKWLFGTDISRITKQTIQNYYQNRKLRG